MTSIIYLDNSATTKVRQEVVDAMLPFLSEKWGNPSSIHKLGRHARQAVDTAREQVARLIGAEPDEIYFTPCGTYSNNTAILGRARWVEANGLGKHLITSCIEHSSSLGPTKYLESCGWKISHLHVDEQGFFDAKELREKITPETSIVSLMWANNEVGTVQPVEEIAAICKEKNVFFHSDAIQVTGKIPIDVSKLPVSTLSISGHKFYAPKGIGVLYARKGVNLMPIVFGGGQEMGMFPGTESLPNIVAIGAAAEALHCEIEANVEVLRNIQKMLIEKLAHDAVKLTGARDLQRRLPGHVSVVVQGAVGEELVVQANFKGVCISSVSACQQAGHDPSHVLKCIGLPREEMIGSARISAGRFNTLAECETAAEILNTIFQKVSSKSVQKV